ncbi:AI-2E family transporter [Kaistia dalseonensis]|uniref:PurR-regulated permease PerM n=1 Tax=Kaistia dalseonensis TaxID=410840 RepID=A0ABU0H822_9HYPH|nr:AI-2E family transporter [Kaistia dalseonensis]MCX5495857.1 AI-2E family transporter [Kaistia dalseonensis]MDQ0438458.1 putative PurR-regulated permease PerM [Kaistia dalseonensis]
MAQDFTPSPVASDDATARWRSHFSVAISLIAVGIGLYLVWLTSSSLLILFAGVLFAAFLDACTRALRPILPIARIWRLSLVILILTLLSAWGIFRGAVGLPEQVRSLISVMDAQLDFLQQRLLAYGIEMFGPDGGRDFSRFFPGDTQLFGHAQFAVGTATSFLAGLIVIVFVGLLFSFDPAVYRESIVLCVPPRRRPRVRQVLDEMGGALRMWLVAQCVRMLLMFVAVWIALYALQLPGAFLLAVQAGVLNFIPYLGPILAGIPIALVAMPLGVPMLVWAVGIYTVIQTIEGYVIGPLIQRRAASIPPAWTLVGIVLIGALFGTLGIALAMPLMALARIAILRFYVEDWLGDAVTAPVEPEPAERS